MLLNKFYSVQQRTTSEHAVEADIRFDRLHPVFEGHFPGNPVVPGVCMLQIIRELTEDALRKKLLIRDGDNIKFLNVINPDTTPVVRAIVMINSSGDSYEIQASLQWSETTYFKFKGTFQEI